MLYHIVERIDRDVFLGAPASRFTSGLIPDNCFINILSKRPLILNKTYSVVPAHIFHNDYYVLGVINENSQHL